MVEGRMSEYASIGYKLSITNLVSKILCTCILKLCVKYMPKYYILYRKGQNKTAAHVIDKWLVYLNITVSHDNSINCNHISTDVHNNITVQVHVAL